MEGKLVYLEANTIWRSFLEMYFPVNFIFKRAILFLEDKITLLDFSVSLC